jgi:exportin-T
MSDDFEKAVLFSFDQSGNVGAELRQQAQALLAAAAASPDAWQLCLARLEASGYAEVKFWCLQTLTELVRSPGYSTLAPPARAQLRRALVGAGVAPPPAQLPPFLRNKLAQAVVALAARDYPDEWPTFFQDLLGTLGQGAAAVDLFCRVLAAVDEDIISLEVPRSAEEAKQSMRFKDAMREHALGDVAAAWASVVAGVWQTAPGAAAAVLAAAQRYIHWIDIGLVANDTFVPLLFAVLGSEDEGLR